MTTRQDLTIRQGETFSFSYTKRDSAGSAVDLTGYTARMAIRDRIGGVLEAYLSTGADANGGTITLGGAAGTVVISMTAAQTAAIATSLEAVSVLIAIEEPRLLSRTVEFLYDLELVNGATVIRELEGRAIIHRQVTS